jgi:carboxymethylenebutenolidase
MIPRTDLLSERIEIPVNEAPMGAYRARPGGREARGGVIVAHELFGVTAHVRDVCDRVAGLGYVALAPELYHRVGAAIELAHDQPGRERGFRLLHSLEREHALNDLAAAMAALREDGCQRVAVLGLSVGGHVAYLAATELALDATVVLYGGWIPTTDIPLSQPDATITRTSAIRAPVLFLVGADDNVVPPEHRQAIAAALEASVVPHELIEYPDTPHGFLCDRRPTYTPAAAEDAWRRIAQLLERQLS